MNRWEKSREIDRRFLGWVWNDDGRIQWRAWLLVAGVVVAGAVGDLVIGRTENAVFGLLGALPFIVIALARRRSSREASPESVSPPSDSSPASPPG